MTDFLVVGAGSSGAAVAARLVEAGAGVSLVEGGPDWGATGQLDERLRYATGLFNFDAYSVMPEYYWQDLESRPRPERPTARYLRGKGGGGSSFVNECYAIRPPLEDFDSWAEEGCTGWSGQDVLPYFNRLEQDLDFASQPYHGSNGPIPLRRLDQSGWGTMDRAFATVAQETGLPWAPDHNAPGSWGVSPFAANIIDNRRVSTGEAYLEPLRGRPNFQIVGEALVDTVLFNGSRAVGARVIKNGKIAELYADEIIISEGSSLSPEILQRSGIGPSSVLGQVGVATRVELPVGESLQDHQGLLFRVNLKAPTHASEAGQRSNVMARWSSGLEGTRNGDMMACAINVSPESNGEEVQTASILAVLNQVFSRVSVHINTADPTVMPIMDMNFLSHELDLRRQPTRNGQAHRKH